MRVSVDVPGGEKCGARPRTAPRSTACAGEPANNVTVRANRDAVWTLGNLGLVGGNVVTVVDGITYRAHGCTVEPTPEGTSFSNDATGHGMFVSAERVEHF